MTNPGHSVPIWLHGALSANLVTWGSQCQFGYKTEPPNENQCFFGLGPKNIAHEFSISRFYPICFIFKDVLEETLNKKSVKYEANRIKS